MANIVDYIEWRGDLSFDVNPLNEIDALIFSQLSYINFKDIVPKEFVQKKNPALTLAAVGRSFFDNKDFENRKNVGSMINPLTIKLLELAAKSVRYGNLVVSGYEDIIDYSSEEQYSSITFSRISLNKNWNFIAYRGTDDSILGWKEDCNMVVEDVVPAQKEALAYLKRAAESLKGRLYVGGHSKGGNLAIYAATNSSVKLKNRLDGIFNNDGPGFSADFFEKSEFTMIKEKVHTYVPELSIVGMLFNHAPGYSIVKSSEKNMIDQHDPFGWQVIGTGFIELEERSEQSKFAADTVNTLLSELDRDEKKQFIDTVFGLLDKTNARTNTELSSDKLENITKILKAATKLDGKTKDSVLKTMQAFVKIAWNNKDELKRR